MNEAYDYDETRNTASCFDDRRWYGGFRTPCGVTPLQHAEDYAGQHGLACTEIQHDTGMEHSSFLRRPKIAQRRLPEVVLAAELSGLSRRAGNSVQLASWVITAMCKEILQQNSRIFVSATVPSVNCSP